MSESRQDSEIDELRSGTPITRRDFINGALVGAGTSLLYPRSAGAALDAHTSPEATDSFTGYGGVGDYAGANGNTWNVVQAAHRIRDGVYTAEALAGARDGGEFDVVVVGGGIAGLSAAHYFAKATHGGRRALILENHPVLGGEARQNEFLVQGERLLGPQGSNDYLVPAKGDGSLQDRFFDEFSLPRQYEWQSWPGKLKPIRFVRDNASNWDGFQETQFDIGYYFAKGANGRPVWLRDIWKNGLAQTPFSAQARRDLLRWRASTDAPDEAMRRHLDSMSYKTYLEKECGYDPTVTQFAEPYVGQLCGVSTDAVSALLGRQLVEQPDKEMSVSFPGGNTTFARSLLRALIPDALPGKDFDSLLYGSFVPGTFDRADQPTRVRLGATVIRVRHIGSRQEKVEVVYEKGGELFKVTASAAVMASGGWVNRHVLADMPEDLRSAYAQFIHAPALIVNVALRQCGFLYDLGVGACRWFDEPDGFGWTCNLRRLMTTSRHTPALHPDKPTVLTFYMGFPIPGLPAAAQGPAARAKLFATTYADMEVRIRRQLVRLFGSHGFDPARDIAAIVLNRWGHARLVQPPGFRYAADGGPGPLERVRRGYGRVAIGHSELNGSQSWDMAVSYGQKAGERVASLI